MPGVTDHRSVSLKERDLKHREVKLILDLWLRGTSDLCVDCITHKPNHCLEQDQWGRDSSDIMEWTREYFREHRNCLDPTLMHSQ